MSLPLFMVDPDIHASVLESLGADGSGLELLDSPTGATALVTQSVDVDTSLLEAVPR